jgi:hypothetical protein
MKLRNIILGSLLGVFAIGATATAQVGFTVHGGYEAANVKNLSTDGSLTSGARAGVALDIPVYQGDMSRISIQPGVDFAMKGAKMEGTILGTKNTGTLSTYYIDVPVLINFGFDLGNDFGVFVNAGPYVSYGVGGKLAFDTALGSGESNSDFNPFSETVKLGGTEFGLNRFDWGAQVGAGVEWNRLQLGVGTQFGLMDIRKSQNDENSEANATTNEDALRNNTFFVMVGYRF